MKRRTTVLTLVLVAIYAGSYLLFRAQNIERWEKDQRDYLIFPPDNAAIYYLYRPLTLIDGPLTGMQFHIGPHR